MRQKLSAATGRRLPDGPADGSMRRDSRLRGGCAVGAGHGSRSVIMRAVAGPAHRAFGPAEESIPGEAATPVYFLLHLPRTGGNTIAAHLKGHLGERTCTAGRPTPLQLLGGTRVRFDE